MQHRPAPPGETLKQEQMAQAQESNVKRKGQDQTEMQWAAQVLHFIFVEKKQRHLILSLVTGLVGKKNLPP